MTGGPKEAAYEVKIRASGFDSGALIATTPIWVSERPDREQERISVDSETLIAIAKSGGGRYVPESEASSLFESIKPLSSGTIVETDYRLWNSYIWFFALLILLAAEWVLGKRVGLV